MAVDVSWPVAFLAGVVAFLTPCFLPLIPVYLGYLSNVSSNHIERKWYTLLNAALFVVGFSAVFIALGASVGFLGYIVSDQMPTVRKVVAVLLGTAGLIMLFGPYMARWFAPVAWFYREVRFVSVSFEKRGGYLFSLILGILFALAWSPCIGPTLGAILTLAYDSATVKEGTVLLAIFSLGLAAPFLTSALAIKFVSGFLKKMQRFGRVIEIINGVGLILLAWLVFTDNLVKLNSWFEAFNFVYQWA